MNKPQGKINIDTVIKGIMNNEKKINIAPKAGSLAVSDSAKVNAVNETMNRPEYKQKAKDFIKRLENERDRLLKHIEEHNIVGEYKDTVASLERIAKLKELLSGGVTERTEISSEQLDKFLNNA